MAKKGKKIRQGGILNLRPTLGKKCLFKSVASAEGIVVNLTNGEYYTLNETGQHIWQAIDGKRSVLKIGKKIAAQYKTRKSKVMQEISHFLSTLHRKGLVTLK